MYNALFLKTCAPVCVQTRSNPVRVRVSLRGLLPSGASVCFAQQRHRDSSRCCEICHRDPTARRRQVQRHRYGSHVRIRALRLSAFCANVKRAPLQLYNHFSDLLITFFSFLLPSTPPLWSPCLHLWPPSPSFTHTHTHTFRPALFLQTCNIQGFGTTFCVESASSPSLPM